jgi:hypothetical protein
MTVQVAEAGTMSNLRDKLPGFRQAGTLRRRDQRTILTGELPRQCGVYAWVLGRRIVYVGYAWNLRARTNAHRSNAFRKLRYPRRHLIELGRTLKAGAHIRIFIATPKPRTFKGLPVNTALGLEDGLIGMLKPPWNDLRKNPRQLRSNSGL